MPKWSIAVVLTLALVCTGCPSPDLTRRFNSLDLKQKRKTGDMAYAEASVSVRAVPASTSQPSPLALLMGDRGQAAFAEAVSWSATKPSEIITELSKPVHEKEPPAVVINNTRFSKRLFFAVSRTFATLPGDRLDAVQLKLSIDGSDLKFLSVSRFESEFQTVELGKLTGTQETSYEIAASTTPGDSAPSASGSAKLTGKKGLNEEVQLRNQVERLSVQISPARNELTIYRSGDIGIDVTGVFFVDVELQYDSNPSLFNTFRALRTSALFKERKPLSPGSFDFDVLQITSPMKPVNATLTGLFRLRGIAGGRDTITESDDNVKLIDGDFASSHVELIGKQDIIEANTSYHLKSGERVLAVGSNPNNATPINFLSQPDAEGFLTWLQSNDADITLNNVTHLYLRAANRAEPLTVSDSLSLQVVPGAQLQSNPNPPPSDRALQIQNLLK